jgi:hypothetical protein
MMFSARWLFAIFCVLFLGSGIALAQQSPPSGEDKKSEKTATSKEKPQTGKRARPQPKSIPKVQELEELQIIGRIQKPEVFYVLGRSDFSYKGLNLKKSFVDRIKKSVRNNPF